MIWEKRYSGTTPEGYYRPLPNNLELRTSPIHGHGIFAREDIEHGHEFGATHLADGRFQQGSIRLPLGAFVNYSDAPNAELYEEGDLTRLRSLRPIKNGEEVTVKYLTYDPQKKETNNYIVPSQSLDR